MSRNFKLPLLSIVGKEFDYRWIYLEKKVKFVKESESSSDSDEEEDMEIETTSSLSGCAQTAIVEDIIESEPGWTVVRTKNKKM